MWIKQSFKHTKNWVLEDSICLHLSIKNWSSSKFAQLFLVKLLINKIPSPISSTPFKPLPSSAFSFATSPKRLFKRISFQRFERKFSRSRLHFGANNFAIQLARDVEPTTGTELPSVISQLSKVCSYVKYMIIFYFLGNGKNKWTYIHKSKSPF